MARRFVTVLIAALLGGLATGAAQEQATQDQAAEPQVAPAAAVLVRDMSDGEGSRALAELLVRRLGAELETRGYNLVNLAAEAIGMGDPSEPRVTVVRLDETAGSADLLIAAFFRLEGDAIVVQFVLIDPVVDIVVGGVLSRQRAGVTISTSVDDAIGDLQPALDRWESDRDVLRRGPPPDKVDRIFVEGPQEDVRVRFAELEIGEVRAGRIFVPYSPFPVGTSVPMTLSRPGYHSRQEEIVLDGAQVRTTLPRLYPASTIGLSALWSSSSVLGAGLGLRFYPQPDVFYAGIEHYQSVAPAPSGRAVRGSESRLAIGLYAGATDSPLRGFVELGGGVVLTDLEQTISGLVDDPLYSDLFVGAAAGLELNLGRWKPFIRADVDYALGITASNLLGNRWLSPPVTALPVPVPVTTLGVQHTW